METKTEKVISDFLHQVKGKGCALMVSIQGTECTSGMVGEQREIAKALFTIIHDEENELGQSIYEILKMVATNIVGNPSPYADDLYTSVCNAVTTSALKRKTKTVNIGIINGEA